ncbi:hypothetical protein GALMADRAFT_249536 [Galerina marginata CBS 339.88]|uniref:F-box domain-containing protein n=1 Tax=Galerina marginata (strain CBS 339.88) TaxID=685588 RepID=A0A067SUL4_GALM3|nr:hypothetical protein GALMADRAFT_249536 [Galerina marginata CBS 339.88]
MTSSFAPFSDLSQELIDQIIDALFDNHDIDKCEFDLATSELSPREMSDFCACALVCRSFRHRSQKHVFSSMTVLGTRSTKFDQWWRVDKLSEIMQENPRVASYVRRLCFNLTNITQQIVEDPFFLHLMEGITRDWAVGMRLELAIRVSIRSTGLQFQDNEFLETNFIQTSATPFITSLKLYYVHNVPVTLFAHFPYLMELELDEVNLKAVRPDQAINIDPSLRPRLQKFKFKNSYGDTKPELATTFIDFSHLIRISLDADLSDELPGIICILDASSRSLEYMHVSFAKPFSGSGRLSDVYDLSKFPNLSFLSFEVKLKMADDKDPLPNLCQMLCTIPGHKNKIKTVVLYVTIDLPPLLSYSACLDRLADWRPFAIALAKIAERERLVLKFKFDISGAMKAEGMLDKLDEEMRRWTADNRELMTKLSSNISPEYEYKVI